MGSRNACSRSHDATIRVYDATGNGIQPPRVLRLLTWARQRLEGKLNQQGEIDEKACDVPVRAWSNHFGRLLWLVIQAKK